MSRAFQYYRSVRVRRLLNRNISVPLHILTTVYACLLAADVFACSTCLDSGTIEQRETCKVCKFAKGRVPDPRYPSGTCLVCKGAKVVGQYRRRCADCLGTGERYKACPNCGGTGTRVWRIVCPTCKGVSVINHADAMTSGLGGTGEVPVKDAVAVEACTQCDEKGKITKKIVCEICERGWNHKKNDSGAFLCRKCGAVCEGRFTACKCGTPDCPHCKGEYEKTVSGVCPLCNGDKIITPLERAKAQKGKKE